MFKTILCAIDGSDFSGKALAVACDLTAMYESQLHLIHAADYRAFLTIFGPDAGLISVTQEEFEEAPRKTLKDAEEKVKELGCLSVDTHFVNGAPASAITEKAKNIGADLIVLGAKGHSDFSSLMVGSISHKVCNSSECNCLIVR